MRDMTVGNPTKHVVSFAIPMILGGIFQQLYNTVDSVIVGRYVGANALASVGAAFPAMFFFVSFIMGLTIGVQIIISQLFGAGDHVRLKRTFSTAIISLTIMMAIMSVVGYFATSPMLRLINTPPEIIGDSITYLKVIFKGLIFMYLYNMFTSMLRGVGDSKTPLYFLIISSFINIILDLYFVLKLGRGVEGVATATVIAQAVSAVLCIIYTYHKVPFFRLKLSELTFDWEIFKFILKFGIPTAIQQSIISMGSMAVQGLVNSFGATAAAAFTAGNKVESFVLMPIMNIGNALSTYIGQNTGAGKQDRVRTGFKSITLVNVLMCVVLSAAIILSSSWLIEIFIDASETEVIRLGVQYLTTLSYFYFLQAITACMGGFFRGVGDMKTAMTLSMTTLVVRIFSAYLMAGSIGYLSISVSQPIGWLCTIIMGVIAYRSNRWARFAVAKAEAGQAEDNIIPTGE